MNTLSAFAIGAVLLTVTPLHAADLCGTPDGTAAALLDRAVRTERLPEVHRDHAYLAYRDAPRTITWTFTRAGHPAHPSAVCRRLVDNEGKLFLEMQVVCESSETACRALLRDFEQMNAAMMNAMKQTAKKAP